MQVEDGRTRRQRTTQRPSHQGIPEDEVLRGRELASAAECGLPPVPLLLQ